MKAKVLSVMKSISSFSNLFLVNTVILLLGLYGGPANAASPTVSNLYVPLEGEVTLSNGDVVTFSGQVHVLTQVTFSDAFVPTVNMYINLIGVEGTSATSGRTYLLVGAYNVEWVSGNPGPPVIPDQTFNFSLVESNPGPPDTSPGPPQQPPGPPQQPPGPPTTPPNPILPVFLRDFVFTQEAGFEGTLQNVVASFLSD
jgi:hypothetical protein